MRLLTKGLNLSKKQSFPSCDFATDIIGLLDLFGVSRLSEVDLDILALAIHNTIDIEYLRCCPTISYMAGYDSNVRDYIIEYTSMERPKLLAWIITNHIQGWDMWDGKLYLSNHDDYVLCRLSQ